MALAALSIEPSLSIEPRSKNISSWNRRLRRAGQIGLVMLGAFVAPANLPAQEVKLETSAVSKAPQDAAFFATSVNNRWAWDEFVAGKFVTRLRAVPFIQELEGELMSRWESGEGQFGQARSMLQNPNIRSLVDLALDMQSSEIFIYGGDDWCDTLEGLVDLQADIYGVMGEGPEAVKEYFDSLTSEDVESLRMPTTLIGFKLSDNENATQQLNALQGIVQYVLGQVEEAKPFVARLKRNDLDDGMALSITLDSALIPVEQISEDEREIVMKVVELLGDRSLTIALGVKDSTLLIAFSEADGVIESWGEDSATLINHDAMDVLKEANPDALRSVGFVSERFRESAWRANYEGYVQRTSGQFVMALRGEVGDIPEITQWIEDIERDAEWLDGEIAEMAPEFGPMLSWSHGVENGLAGMAYDWTENLYLNSSPGNEMSQYAGKNPLLMIVSKQQENEEVNEIIEYVLDKAPGHIKRFIELAEDDIEDRDKALMVVDRVMPMIEDMYAIVRDKIAPALEDNEAVFAMAAEWTTRSLGSELPPSRTPLPLLEMAGACKLSNRDLFLSGCEEMFGVIDQVVDLVREVEPDSVPPNYSVPRPDEEAIAGGTRYFYRVLSDLCPDEGFEPQLVVTNDVVAFGYSKRQVDDILEPKASENLPDWVTPETPVAVLSFVDLAGMFAMAKPWVEYGIAISGRSLNEPIVDERGPIPTGSDILQIVDCFSECGTIHGSTGTEEADGPIVTRWTWTN